MTMTARPSNNSARELKTENGNQKINKQNSKRNEQNRNAAKSSTIAIESVFERDDLCVPCLVLNASMFGACCRPSCHNQESVSMWMAEWLNVNALQIRRNNNDQRNSLTKTCMQHKHQARRWQRRRRWRRRCRRRRQDENEHFRRIINSAERNELRYFPLLLCVPSPCLHHYMQTITKTDPRTMEWKNKRNMKILCIFPLIVFFKILFANFHWALG